jgi:RNA polymerase sigma-70 factor (sigma-E family)
MVGSRAPGSRRRSGSGNVRPRPCVPEVMTTVPLEPATVAPPWDERLVALYERHYGDLVRLAYLVSGQASQAEEVVQDAFVQTHRSWARVRDPLPYLRTAVINGCRSVGRRQTLERARRPLAPEPVPLGADELWDALAGLTERQRAALVLRFYCDLPDAEIATALGCRETTVRTSVHRALAKLRKEIDR